MTMHHVWWKPSDRQLEISNHKVLLFSLLERRVHIEHDCMYGHCRACLTRLIAGRVEHLPDPAISQDELEAGLILPCACRPVSDELVLDLVVERRQENYE